MRLRTDYFCSTQTEWQEVEKTGYRSETASSLQCKTTGKTRGRVQGTTRGSPLFAPPCYIVIISFHLFTFLILVDRQVSQREQADGAVQVFESHRGADQNVVSESPHEVEEAAHVQAEDRAEAGTVSTDVFSDHPVSSSTVLRGAFDVRCPFVGRREF